MDPVSKFVYAALTTVYVSFVAKIMWDHYKSGRMEKGVYLTMQEFKEHKEKCCTKDDYLTKHDFEKHKEQCCILTLKKDFNACQQDSCTVQADHSSRLKVVEEKLRDGQATFLALDKKMDEKFDAFGEKFDRMNSSLAGIKGILNFAIGNKAKMVDNDE